MNSKIALVAFATVAMAACANHRRVSTYNDRPINDSTYSGSTTSSSAGDNVTGRSDMDSSVSDSMGGSERAIGNTDTVDRWPERMNNDLSSSSASGTSSGTSQDASMTAHKRAHKKGALHRSGSRRSVSGSTTSATTGNMASKSVSGVKLGQDYTVLIFSPGSDQLSETGKQSLRSVIDTAKASGNINEVHIAAWSDKMFPADKNAGDLSKEDRDLADRRLKSIQGFLKDDLSLHSDIDTYSMAEKSNWFARAFRTDDAELKSLFAQQGAPASVTQQQLGVVKEKGGPMKAVVLVLLKNSHAWNSRNNGNNDAMIGTGVSRVDTDTTSATSTSNDTSNDSYDHNVSESKPVTVHRDQGSTTSGSTTSKSSNDTNFDATRSIEPGTVKQPTPEIDAKWPYGLNGTDD